MKYSEWADEDINKEMQRRWALKLGYTDLKWFEDHYGESFGKRMLRSSAHWAGVLPEGQPKAEGQYWNDDIRVEIPAKYDWVGREDLCTNLADEFFWEWSMTYQRSKTMLTPPKIYSLEFFGKTHLAYKFVGGSRARALCEALLDYSDGCLNGLFSDREDE